MTAPRCRHALYPEPILIDGIPHEPAAVIAALESQVTERRRKAIARVVADRTWNVVSVLEGIYDFGNINAVMRSAEALSFQRMHAIETVADYKEANRVAQGAEKWIDLVRWKTTSDCVAHLKGKGYRILATSLEGAEPIGDYAFDQPTALVFGNERAGVTDEMLEAADGCVRIPMAGFTQSFNISVAAALCFYHIRQDRIARLGAHGDLSPEEQEHLIASYYARHVTTAPAIMRRIAADAD